MIIINDLVIKPLSSQMPHEPTAEVMCWFDFDQQEFRLSLDSSPFCVPRLVHPQKSGFPCVSVSCGSVLYEVRSVRNGTVEVLIVQL